MKQHILAIMVGIALGTMGISASQAHTIGGAYARLISCDYGQFGYEYGYIGTYDVNGQIIKQYFGKSYCPY